MKLLWLACMLLVITSCSRTITSCDFDSADICWDFGGDYTASVAQSACTTATGTYAAAACSATGRVGSCLLVQSASLSRTTRYYSPTWDATTAPAQCTTDGGTYTAN